MSHAPHDAMFRYTFGKPENVGPLSRQFLPAPIVREVDWGMLRPLSGTHVDRRLRRQHTALLFETRFAGLPAVLYVLFEHKSRHDRWAVLQMLGYVVTVWRSRRRSRARELPFVLPVLFHHGRRPWRAPTEIAALLPRPGALSEGMAMLDAMQPRFQHFVISLADCTPDQLRGMALTVLGKITCAALQFLPGATAAQVVAAVKEWADLLRDLWRAPSGADAMAALSSYVLATTVVEADTLIEVVDRHVESGVGEAMRSTAARLRAEGKLEGRVEGKIEGKIEGKLEGKVEGRAEGRAELLLHLLEARFGPVSRSVTATVNAAPIETLDAWALRCLTASSLDEVFAAR